MHYVMQLLIDPIRQYPEIAIFLTLAIGFWFGSLKIRSFSLGSVTSTLIAGLLVGQLNVPVAPVVQSTFFLMFLFAVGYSVGPQFFRGLKKDGLPQVAFALIVCVSGLLCAYVLAKILGYNVGVAAGLLSGGYTNSGTLGVAAGYFKQLGLSADKTAAMASLAAIAYAVTYPFGTAGAAWFLGTLGPKLLKVDLAASCKELERSTGFHAAEPGVHSAYRPVVARAYRVENASLIGRKVRAISGILGISDTFIIRVRQNGGIVDSDNGTVLQNGATVAVAGPSKALLTLEKTVGPEVDDAELLSFPTEQLDVVVTNKAATNHAIKELQNIQLTDSGHEVFVSKLTRFGQEVKPDPDLQLQRHDVVTLLGARGDIERAAKYLGYADRAGISSDIKLMSAAVVIGGLVGALTLHIGGIPLSLSPSVGALVAGLVCGYLRSIYRTFGQIPEPALWVFNNVGLNGFIAVVGLNAATGLVAGLKAYGLGLFVAGMVVSIIPLVVGVFVGKYVFKFHPGILLGACAGARTTTAALGAIQEAANSAIPAVGYTIPYAVGRIVLAISGLVIVALTK